MHQQQHEKEVGKINEFWEEGGPAQEKINQTFGGHQTLECVDSQFPPNTSRWYEHKDAATMWELMKLVKQWPARSLLIENVP
eukprot:1400623-Amphidinium_carterae.1